MVARVWRFAQALGMERSELEVAMLYGIRTDEQLRLAREGFTVRDLIAYGDAWYGWYLRRLAERPANVWFVARQLPRSEEHTSELPSTLNLVCPLLLGK